MNVKLCKIEAITKCRNRKKSTFTTKTKFTYWLIKEQPHFLWLFRNCLLLWFKRAASKSLVEIKSKRQRKKRNLWEKWINHPFASSKWERNKNTINNEKVNRNDVLLHALGRCGAVKSHRLFMYVSVWKMYAMMLYYTSSSYLCGDLHDIIFVTECNPSTKYEIILAFWIITIHKWCTFKRVHPFFRPFICLVVLFNLCSYAFQQFKIMYSN